jgi:regulator of protease activity HflC (stomatin/prohibitin superfamily)
MTKSFARKFRKVSNGALFAFLILVFLVIVFWNHVAISVSPGHAGVMWWRLFGGTDTRDRPLGEGLHLIFPWDRIYIYDMRLREKVGSYTILSRDGMHLKVSLTIRWRLISRTLGRLQKDIGPNYVKSLIDPEVGTYVRDRLSKFTVEELLTLDRIAAQKQIIDTIGLEGLPEGIGKYGDDGAGGNVVSLNDINIESITFPPELRDAIASKLREGQVVGEYSFRVEREKLESQRKIVEAEGIRKFQEIVTPAISDTYLRWRGIEATLKLAESNNSKVVIIGNGPGGLPVILNGFDGDGKPPAAPNTGAAVPPSIPPSLNLPGR